MDTKKDIKFLTIENFPTLCRACLVAPEVLYDVFDISFEDQTISSLLNNCVSLKVREDELPQHICEPCTIRICEIFSFRSLCLENDVLLHETLNDGMKSIKEEVIELDPELITLRGDLDQCAHCPSSLSLSNAVKRMLMCVGKATQLCASCGKSYLIEYEGSFADDIPDMMPNQEPKPDNALTKASFSHICRTCINKPDVMYQILDISFNSVPIKDLLEDCMSIKVAEDDELPSHICEACTSRLCQMYTFKQICLESESLLQQTLGYNVDIIKDEGEGSVDIKNIKRNLDSESEGASGLENIKEEDEDDDDNDDVDFKLRKTCSVCNKSVSHQSYWRHKQLHAIKKNPFQCSKCSATFTLHCNLKRHLMIHSGERPHLCDYCGKSFIQANTLIEHKRTHTGEKPYSCKMCEKSWSQYSSYKSHIDKQNCSGMMKVGTNTYDCNECCGSFTSKQELKAHSCDDTPLDCKICDRKFITRNALKIHIRTHNEPKLYTCTMCDEKFTLRVMFTRHMARHRNTQHICNECGKGFSNYSGLWSHRKVHTGEQPYRCNVCQRAFSQAGSLKSHMLIHTGEKPYTCQICMKTFTQPNHLKYHLRTHSGEKPYNCSYCQKSFSLNGTLTVHMRIHTGETPYHCDICNKGFYDSSSMKKHRRTHDLSNRGVYSASGKNSIGLQEFKRHLAES